MKNFCWIFLFFLQSSIAQNQQEVFLTDFTLGEELRTENLVNKYTKYDFSKLWTQTKNHRIFGIIGLDHERIKIKLIDISKDPSRPYQYMVVGKSCVKGTICTFEGVITIKEIREAKEGVGEYAGMDINGHGVVIADYEFREDKKQRHSGVFKGRLYSKWYIDADKALQYDDLLSIADGYSNNAFVGVWKSYTTGKEKICNWGDARVPKSNPDFDVGTGEFSPSEKYFDKGWRNYQQAWLRGDEGAKEVEMEEWWQ